MKCIKHNNNKLDLSEQQEHLRHQPEGKNYLTIIGRNIIGPPTSFVPFEKHQSISHIKNYQNHNSSSKQRIKSY